MRPVTSPCLAYQPAQQPTEPGMPLPPRRRAGDLPFAAPRTGSALHAGRRWRTPCLVSALGALWPGKKRSAHGSVVTARSTSRR